MSYLGPNTFSAIAVSSICHPGLPPLNQGSFQEGSFSFDFFHKQKSPLFFFFPLSSILVTASSASSVFLPDNLPYSGNLPRLKYTPSSSITYAHSFFIKVYIWFIISLILSVALAYISTESTPNDFISS